MANQNLPQGLSPVTKAVPYPYPKDASADAVWMGGVVILEADGNIAPATSVTAACLGIAAQYSASATAESVLVYHDPEQLFIIQANGSIAESAIGANASLVLTGGTTANPQSKIELKASSIATTNNILRIVGKHAVMGNAYGSFVKLVVKINKHQLGHGTGTAGI